MKHNLCWFLLNILVAMSAAVPLANASDDSEIVERARSLYAQARAHPQEDALIARLAEEAGAIVNEARKTELGLEQLETLRSILDAMQTLVEQLVAKAERRTNQNEAALERLYRSPAWDNLSFANAAFTYWTAWIDLEIAQRVRIEKDRDEILMRARKGFQLASLQLFRPGLYYGGWLGIGYVAMLQGQLARSRQVINKLDDALSRAPDTPVRHAVSLELRLLEARMGDVKKATSISKSISDNEAKMLRIEVFALLEKSRREDKPPAGVAQRLKVLIQAGRMDQSLLENMMAYGQQVAAIDVGPWTDLAAAEYRLQHKDYGKAMQKYEAFFKESIPLQGINLDGYRYRWALAAYNTGSYHAAARILEKLARQQGLAADIDKAVSKLLYAVQLARSSDSPAGRKAMRLAAQQFVNKNPDDPDADTARLIIAQTSSDTDHALEALNRIRSKSRHGGDVERTVFHFIARDFSARIARGRPGLAIDSARKGMAAYHELPVEDRRNPLNTATLLQMRALADPGPNELLNSLDFLDNLKTADVETQQVLVEEHPDEMIRLLGYMLIKDNPGSTVVHALSWSRLQLYDRTDNWSGLTELMLALGKESDLNLPVEAVYPWIAEREDKFQRLELAQLAHPSASTQPDIDRRFYRLIIESLITLEDHGAAYEKARRFTREYPNSGDAWRLLARTAELTNDPFEADRAWRVISDKLLPTTTTWWEAMLNRARIRAASTRPEQACPLLEEIQRRIEHIPDSQETVYETILESSLCGQIPFSINSSPSINLRPAEYPFHILGPS